MAKGSANPTEGKPLILIVPGLDNSGPGHWQTVWEETRRDCRRVELGMWDKPHRNTWVNQLNLAIHAADRPVILAAHSLGCLAVAWWARLEPQGLRGKVRGALLVAPPEVDHRLNDARVAGFAPMPRDPLPFPAILVGSRNDHYMGFRAVEALARQWQCAFADAGAAGHINAASGLGGWPFGQFLLEQLIRRDAQPVDRPAPPRPAPQIAPLDRLQRQAPPVAGPERSRHGAGSR